MTTKINSHKDDSFVMTGVECAAFIVANRGKIASRLKGRVEDKDDAIAEVACKCIGIGLGTGVCLMFDKDPFATARTREQWIAFAVWQCRARLGIIHSSRNYWIDPGEDAQSEEADYRRRKVDEFKAYEFDRESGCHHPIPGRSYDESVRYRAGYKVLEDLVAELSVSRRDMQIWMACDMFRRDRAELAEKFDVKPNNLDQVIFRVRHKIRKFGPALHRRHEARLFYEAG